MTPQNVTIITTTIQVTDEELAWLLAQRDDRFPTLQSLISNLICCAKSFDDEEKSYRAQQALAKLPPLYETVNGATPANATFPTSEPR